MRTPFQGVWNIIRFNWPFYVLSLVVVLFIFLVRYNSSGWLTIAANILLFLIVASTIISLLVSWYVYDHSGFYELNWLDDTPAGESETIVNINAGFDETSALLENRYKNAELIVCDFYDPAKHTAASIARARKAYPPFSKTQSVSTVQLPLKDASANKIFAILSAHEIRSADERNSFFSELARVLSPRGQIVVVEHLRDTANYLAYNIGAFHFHKRADWLNAFSSAGLTSEREMKITPFLTAFFLKKNGTAP